MKKLLLSIFILAGIVCCTTASAGFEGLNSGTSLKIFNKIDCSTGMSCTKVKDKFTISTTGGLQSQVAATATTITEAQCGSSFISSGAVQIELPEASTVLGCRLTFYTGAAANFDINPDDADQIMVETDAVGDSIRNATVGNSITIEAISGASWSSTAVIGTWADNN